MHVHVHVLGLSAETSDNLHVVRDTPLGTVKEMIERTVRHSLDVPDIAAVSSFSFLFSFFLFLFFSFLHQSIGPAHAFGIVSLVLVSEVRKLEDREIANQGMSNHSRSSIIPGEHS